MSRAEARVRVAEEMAVNNSRARARLAATQVLRWVGCGGGGNTGPLTNVRGRLSAQTRGTQPVYDEAEPGEEVDLGVWLGDVLAKWMFGEVTSEAAAEGDSGDTAASAPVTEEAAGEDTEPGLLALVWRGEEQHLELFYLASCALLAALSALAVRRSLAVARRKARLLLRLRGCERERGPAQLHGPGPARQLSFH